MVYRATGVAVAVVVASCSMSSAALQVYQNNGQFFWQPDSFSSLRNFFDPSLPPSANPAATGAYEQLPGDRGSSGSITFGKFLTTGSTIVFAQDPQLRHLDRRSLPPFSPFDAPVPLVFSVGQTVGPAATFGSSDLYVTQNPGATVSLISAENVPFYVGFRISKPDGVHYGWVQLVHEQVFLPTTSPFAFQPRSWGYEDTPNTPATVVPAPSIGAILGLAAAAAFRRRR